MIFLFLYHCLGKPHEKPVQITTSMVCSPVVQLTNQLQIQTETKKL